MPFARPTLSALVARVDADLIGSLGLSGTPSVALVRVLARVFAGLVHSLHGHLSWIARQILPDTAEREFLERWASLFGLARKPPSFATGFLIVSGTAGVRLPAACSWRMEDRVYVLDGTGTRTLGADGTLLVPVVCRTAGPEGNVQVGTSLRLSVAVTGVKPAAVAEEISGGVPAEGDDSLRARLLARLRLPPQGGSSADYIRWATSVPGLTRAWVRTPSAGALTVLVVADDDKGVRLPTPAQLAAAVAYIEERRPVTALVFVRAPTLRPVAVTLRLTPDTSTARDTVSGALSAVFKSIGPGDAVLASRLAAAAVLAPGVTAASLLSPVADVPVGGFEIATLGDITWAA